MSKCRPHKSQRGTRGAVLRCSAIEEPPFDLCRLLSFPYFTVTVNATDVNVTGIVPQCQVHCQETEGRRREKPLTVG